jgi:DoxX-like family
MFTAYVVVTGLTAAANTFAATADFTRPKWLLGNMAKARVPQSWLFQLGALKAAGALGLLVGIGIAPLGVAASIALILFFIGALITHIRARYWEIAAPVTFLLLAVGSLVLRVASS